MKFKIVIFFFFLILATSCTKKSVLETTFNCNGSNISSKTKTLKDIKKNFKISIPTTWKTKLYFDEFQSDVFAADTTNQLTKTYIIDASWKVGELILDASFEDKIKEISKNKITFSKFENIQNKPSFWCITKDEKKNFEYHELKIYIKTSIDTYLEITTQIYGDTNVNDRICQAIKLIKTIEFI